LADILLEVCIDDALGLRAAVDGGADRIELCSALALGGLTPSAGLIAAASVCGLPCHAMIRPRAGDFVFDAAEVAVMKADIRAVRAAGLAGVVLGASRADGRLDLTVLAALVAEAQGLDLTLHRAIDLCPDAVAAVHQAADLGFHRILSSGGTARAADGIERLAAMVDAARGRLIVMPGSGVGPEVLDTLSALPLSEIHASCAAGIAADGPALALGFQTGAERRTDPARVAALKAALRALPPRGPRAAHQDERGAEG
jgi:copper homeostasis protein